MSKQIEALKLALEALEEINKLSIGENAIYLPAEIDTAIDAIREALAEQPAQQREHVIDCPRCGHCCPQSARQEPVQQPYAQTAAYIESATNGRVHVDPVTGDVGIGKNQPVQPKQEPAFWTRKQWGMDREFCEKPFTTDWEPLYTSPPANDGKPWVGLTSEDKVEILRANGEAAVLILTEAKLREKNA